MTDDKERSDIEVIFDKVSVLGGKARLVRDKAFNLRSLPSVDVIEKCSEPQDFASDIKSRLDTVEEVLDEAAESLTRFMG